jgi:hypothetical protein
MVVLEERMVTSSRGVLPAEGQSGLQNLAGLRLVLLALLAALSLGGYLFASHLVYRLGFPLDDAWIHQTYARNLGLHGEWAFLPGQPSAGSTAPLWSALLAIGHALRLGPYLWTYLLGGLVLWAIAVVGVRAFLSLHNSLNGGGEPFVIVGGRLSALGVGLFLALEWHLVWAAASGMETALFALFALAALKMLVDERSNWIGLGLLVGLSTWVRPDGITLLGPALLALVLKEGNWCTRFQSGLRLGTGAVLVFAPYLLFNRALSGNWWPNTFFAKQAEYAILLQVPLWKRFLSELFLPLIGPGALLAPGFVLMVIKAARRRAWAVLAAALWVVGYLLLYAMRLPVTYQHGRYGMPVMPAYFVFSLAGMAGWLRLKSERMWERVVSRAWIASLGLVTLAFWFIGARTYAYDVAIIESEMVTTAQWVAENTQPQALVAAHDIGALGYFGERPLLDLAGLVSPEVIPFIRNEAQLDAYLDQRHANYLVTFPGWYPQLVQRGVLIFTTGGIFSPMQGGENMAVYRWMSP